MRWAQPTLGHSKKAAQLRGGSRAAQDWGYEQKYAITDLMQPDA